MRKSLLILAIVLAAAGSAFALSAVTVVKGDTLSLKYQLKEDGAAKDITGMAFKLGVKLKLQDTAYLIGPINSTIDDAATGKFSFIANGTHTDQAPFNGVYEIRMYDSGGNRTTLTPAGGVKFRVIENIID